MDTPIAAAATTASGRQLNLDADSSTQEYIVVRGSRAVERLATASSTSASGLASNLSRSACKKALAGELLDPADPATFGVPKGSVTFTLRRHGIMIDAHRLSTDARDTLRDMQAQADANAGLNWTEEDDDTFAEQLDRANQAGLPIDLDDPAVWAYVEDRRDAVAKLCGVDAEAAKNISRWATMNPSRFAADQAISWRLGSPQWLDALVARGDVTQVDRPVGVLVEPRGSFGRWVCTPVLSVDMMRLVGQLGGKVDLGLQRARIPLEAGPPFARAVSGAVLRVYGGEADTQKIARELGAPVIAPPVLESLDRWGCLTVGRIERAAKDDHEADAAGYISLSVHTERVRAIPARRFGAHNYQHQRSSDGMGLGEAIDHATDAGIPVVLTSEAAGELGDKPRIGRMRARPGLLTITTVDDGQVTSRRLPAEQLPAALRALRDEQRDVTLDAGAVQTLRMMLARPLDDDPILMPPQRKLTAMKAVGSGLDASATGAGKTITTLRAIYHRAQATRRMRALIVAEGRLTVQWHDEMLTGDPGRGMPPLCPNVQAIVLHDSEPVAAQVRRADREAGDRPLVILCPDGVLDRHAPDLQVLDWHLLVADEVLRYANTSTDAFRALRQVRSKAVDCWMLSATPKGRSAEHLDVLVGLALNEDVMIESKLNVREGGDLLIERNAARVRANYGPHLVRITKREMAPYMPATLPAEALGVEPDPGLAELLEEIREGGREAYRRMREMLAQVASMKDAPQDELRAARAELSRWQGMVLGNVGVYVAASVDPEALMTSESVLAKSLVRNGSVEKALRGGGNGMPLLRAVTAEAVSRISVDEQAIVFCDRVVPLRRLGDALRDVHAIDARVADGSTDEEEFGELKRAFQAGDFPVLCLSKVGQKGHNLQGASSIVHYDLPWLDVDLEQRVGRAVRVGSKHSYVSSYIPYIIGAGIEHVVTMLAPRGAEGHNLLDGFEGVSASQSVIAGQLGDITAQVSIAKEAEGRKQAAARLRVAAAVFGRS